MKVPSGRPNFSQMDHSTPEGCRLSFILWYEMEVAKKSPTTFLLKTLITFSEIEKQLQASESANLLLPVNELYSVSQSLLLSLYLALRNSLPLQHNTHLCLIAWLLLHNGIPGPIELPGFLASDGPQVGGWGTDEWALQWLQSADGQQ